MAHSMSEFCPGERPRAFITCTVAATSALCMPQGLVGSAWSLPRDNGVVSQVGHALMPTLQTPVHAAAGV